MFLLQIVLLFTIIIIIIVKLLVKMGAAVRFRVVQYMCENGEFNKLKISSLISNFFNGCQNVFSFLVVAFGWEVYVYCVFWLCIY